MLLLTVDLISSLFFCLNAKQIVFSCDEMFSLNKAALPLSVYLSEDDNEKAKRKTLHNLN